LEEHPKVFRIEGYFRNNGDIVRFVKEVRALKKEHAIEYVLSKIGSDHRVKRRAIKISNVTEISPEEVEDPIVRFFCKTDKIMR